MHELFEQLRVLIGEDVDLIRHQVPLLDFRDHQNEIKLDVEFLEVTFIPFGQVLDQ